MIKKISKAVFPVAGLGSRFLPATKANPKEMLPIVDKPLIQYAVEEAIEAGITELVFVTSSRKHAIEDHFDSNFELESRLKSQDKQELLSITRNILPKGVHCVYIRQAEPRGLGDAVFCARSVIGNEPFAVLLADDLIDSPKQLCLQQMCEVFDATQESVIAVETITSSQTKKYGVVDVQESDAKYKKVNAIVEKPAPQDAPSNLGVAGRYILTPEIFNCLEETSIGAGGEVQLTDAISRLLAKETVNVLPFVGKRYDCGSKLGYLKATVVYGLKHPELADEFAEYLQSIQ